MTVLMCRACGHFVPATLRAEQWIPIPDECPRCTGDAFVGVRSD
jgi:hypothetical protein